MKLLATFLLVGLLALWMGFSSATRSKISTDHPIQQRPGVCPIDICDCDEPQFDQCKNDYICKKNEKCCYSCCAMRCVNTKK